MCLAGQEAEAHAWGTAVVGGGLKAQKNRGGIEGAALHAKLGRCCSFSGLSQLALTRWPLIASNTNSTGPLGSGAACTQNCAAGRGAGCWLAGLCGASTQPAHKNCQPGSPPGTHSCPAVPR